MNPASDINDLVEKLERLKIERNKLASDGDVELAEQLRLLDSDIKSLEDAIQRSYWLE
jgi:hypothetical protein